MKIENEFELIENEINEKIDEIDDVEINEITIDYELKEITIELTNLRINKLLNDKKTIKENKKLMIKRNNIINKLLEIENVKNIDYDEFYYLTIYIELIDELKLNENDIDELYDDMKITF